MLKNILNLKGAQALTTKEQKEINGGLRVHGCDAQLAAKCAEMGGVCYEGICNVV